MGVRAFGFAVAMVGTVQVTSPFGGTVGIQATAIGVGSRPKLGSMGQSNATNATGHGQIFPTGR